MADFDYDKIKDMEYDPNRDYITNLRNFYNIKETNITGEILDISEFNTNDIVQIIPHEKIKSLIKINLQFYKLRYKTISIFLF